MMHDLFGNERPASAPIGKPIGLDLFNAAAEKKAMTSGRPVSQEKAEILAPNPVTTPVCPVHGIPMLLESGGAHKYCCLRCGCA